MEDMNSFFVLNDDSLRITLSLLGSNGDKKYFYIPIPIALELLYWGEVLRPGSSSSRRTGIRRRGDAAERVFCLEDSSGSSSPILGRYRNNVIEGEKRERDLSFRYVTIVRVTSGS